MAKLEWVERDGSLVFCSGCIAVGIRPFKGVYEVLLYVNGDCISHKMSATAEEGMDAAEQALADHLRTYLPLMKALGVVE